MSTVLALLAAIKQVTIYFGSFVLISGLIGGVLNVVVFTSLKTFRETTCALYLTFASIVGMGQLLTALLVRILSDGFAIDPRPISWFCKTYFSASNWCLSVWLTTMCLASMDQWLSMSKYRHLSNVRLAKRLIASTCLFWAVHKIFLLIYWDVTSGYCAVVNPIFAIYFSRFVLPVLYGCLPLGIMIVFSSLAFYKARTLASRQAGIARASRDRQLSAIVLVYVAYITISVVPFTGFYMYTLMINTTDPLERARNGLWFTTTIIMEYSMFSAAFYIYCGVSERFRKQLVYVLTKVCVHRGQQQIHRVGNNEVVPSIVVTVQTNTIHHPSGEIQLYAEPKRA